MQLSGTLVFTRRGGAACLDAVGSRASLLLSPVEGRRSCSNSFTLMTANFLTLIPPKLNFLLLVFLKNSLNSALLLFVYQAMSLSNLSTLLKTLIKIFLKLNISLLFKNHVLSVFGISAAYET